MQGQHFYGYSSRSNINLLICLAKHCTLKKSFIFKVKFEVGGEEVVASGEGGATVEDEDEDAMAEAVIDEVLDGDEGLGSVAGAREAGEDSLDELADDEDFFEVSNMVPSRRLSRKVFPKKV